MHTEHLVEGLQIFAIGFGGVFVNLVVIYLTMLLIGRILQGFDAPDERARGD
jgi:Na+-transporting methylmalonyl-CoA/oxaloacetate decarboxylase gamma subunit